MPSFSVVLVSGSKRPYDSWTFVEVPDDAMAALGSRRTKVRGTIDGVPFRATVSRGEGVFRMAVPREIRLKAGIARGDSVHVVMEVDRKPRPVIIPAELRGVLDADPDLAGLFDELSPAHRRAWAEHVAAAKRPETRERRAARAIEGVRRKAYPGG